MRRINTTNRVANLFGPGKDGFKNGDLVNGVRPTEFNAEWTNAVQEEVLSPIEASGLTVAPGETNQLFKAMNRLYASNGISPYPYGLKGDFVSDDAAALNAAIAATPANAAVVLPDRDIFCATPPINPYGRSIVGPGRILEPTPGGFAQTNSYTKDNRVFVGRERLQALYRAMRSGAPYISVDLHGDSTVQGALLGTAADAGPGVLTSGWLTSPYFLQLLLPLMYAKKGLSSRLNVTNHGVGGTGWSDMIVVPATVAGNDIVILKSSLNEGAQPVATRLQTLRTNMRAKIQEFRAQPGGSLKDLSILVMGPATASNVDSNRDQRWLEQVRGVHLAVCEEFSCAYIDSYSLMQDCKGAAGYWMDNPYGNGQAVHLMDSGQMWLWGSMMDWVFPESVVAIFKTASFFNNSSALGFASPTKAPNTYETGITIERCLLNDGWPDDGKVTTERQPDGVISQSVTSYLPGRTRRFFRTGDNAANTWNPFTGQIVPISLSNGWINFGANFAAPGVSMDESGFVTIRGLIKSGNTGINIVLGVIPVGYRPLENELYEVSIQGGRSSLRVETGGNIVAVELTASIYTSLSGLRYKVA